MELLEERYRDKIIGKLSCFDRVILSGNVFPWCFAEGMTGYLKSKGIRIFDYPKFAEGLSAEVRQHAAQAHIMENRAALLNGRRAVRHLSGGG